MINDIVNMVNDVQAHTSMSPLLSANWETITNKLPEQSQPMSPSNTTSNKDMDSASMASVSTFRSTVSLLKGKLSNKDRKASKEAKAAADRSTVSHDGAVVEKKSRSLPKDSKSRKSIPPPDWNGELETPHATRTEFES